MIIKRFILFITIAGLMWIPWQELGASARQVKKSKTASSSKSHSTKQSSSSLSSHKKKTKTFLRAQQKKAKKLARKRAHRHVAREQTAPPEQPKDAQPLLKITPLDNGKFLLEPMDSSLPGNRGSESLSLIKKPVFEEENPEGLWEEKKDNPLSFSHLLVKVTQQLLGKAYRLGGSGYGNDGIDCSGFVKRIYQALTLSLPHSSREQAKLGSLVTTELDFSRLKIGDLLFFKRNRGSQISHTGIYIGDGKMIHSASKKGVVISDLEKSNYYNRNFVVAKRLFILQDAQADEFKTFKEQLEHYAPPQMF